MQVRKDLAQNGQTFHCHFGTSLTTKILNKKIPADCSAGIFSLCSRDYLAMTRAISRTLFE